MNRIEALQPLATLRWLLAVLTLVQAACSTNGSNPQPNPVEPPSSKGDAATADVAPPNCKPKCGATCGADDGCGGKCACATGLDCKEGVCIDPACGPCRPNERCSDGKCQCVPSCEGRACQANGCGGTCPCPEGTGVNAQGNTVALSQCHDTCTGAGWHCGVLCGVDCGACGSGKACKLGTCRCQPQCDGTSCSDGCGGTCACAAGTVCNDATKCVPPSSCKDTCDSTGRTCGSICGAECGACGGGQSCVDRQCREAVTCRDCTLQLRLIDRQVVDGKIVRVKIGIDVAVPDENSGPRLVDVRLGADRLVSLVEATAGPGLLKTGKDLFVDESTHEPWQKRGDESYQLLAYSVSGTMRVATGRIITLTFDLAEPGPVNFTLARHSQTFAPLDADNVLQASTYDQPLTVSR